MNNNSRKTMTDYIKNNMIDFSDENVNSVYNVLKDVIEIGDQEEHCSRQKKMLIIFSNLQYVDERNLLKIYKDVKNILNPTETKEEKMKRIALDIINKILILMGLNKVDDLCNFINIRRDELLDEKYAKLLDDNKEYIFNNGFSKYECQFYQKKVRNIHISMLKGMLKQIGYTLCSKNHKKMVKGEFLTHTTYSIQKNTV